MPHRLSIATSHDDAIANLAAMYCKDQRPDVQVLRTALDLDTATVSLWRTDGWFTSTCLFEQPLAHPCVTCSLKEAVVAWLVENLRPHGETLLFLPTGAELDLVVPYLSQPEVLNPQTFQITETLYVVDPEALPASLWASEPSSTAQESVQDFEGEAGEDESSDLAFAIESNLMYADHVLTVESTSPIRVGTKLISFLKRPTVIVGTLSAFDFSCIFGTEHQYMLALDYLDPLSIGEDLEVEFDQATELWRAKVPSSKYIHPDRLLPMLRELCNHRIVARGYFHMPTRPETGVWQIAGGGFILGLAEETGLTGSTFDATGQGMESLIDFQELFQASMIDPKTDLPVDDPQWSLHGDCFSSL